LQALQSRRDYFIANGAVSADHGVQEAYTCRLSEAEATAIFDAALAGKATTSQLRDFAGHMLMEMARLSAADGLVMTLHAGVVRNHHTGTLEKFGPDTGHDLPVQAEFTNNLRPMLEAYGLEPNLTLILFCLDESVWARDIAPLAGFYPAVRIGAPWWFLDAPDSGLRFRDKTPEIAGFYRGSGFIDDTRAFLSIPARHDMARRIDSAYLARLVVGGRLTMQQAQQIAVDLVVGIPKAAFKL
jgi:glucuronate isomerase